MLRVYDKLDAVKISTSLNIPHTKLYEHLGSNKLPELKYEVISGAEKEQLIVSILAEMDKQTLRVAGENDNTVWEKGWKETLDRVKAHPIFSMDLLAPKYFEKHKILRLNGNYIKTDSTEFLYQYDQIIRRIIFSKYLTTYHRIVEIGCGTGNSQILLSKICSNNTELIAADWSSSSQELLSILANKLNLKITPVNFNMLTLEGKEKLHIDNETAVFTVHAMEQLGKSHKQFLDFLLASSPSICIHIEPINEFYDDNTLFDYLAARYHEKRNYLCNWLTALEQLRVNGIIEICEQRRLGFGDRYHEAYNLIVWKPIPIK